MFNILIVSNNALYNSEIKRAAALEDVNIQAMAVGIDDVQRYINSGMSPDVVLLSDILVPGTTIEAVVQLLRSSKLTNIYGILKTTQKAEFLMSSSIQYVFENDVTPVELLSMIKNSNTTLSREDLNERDIESVDTKNIANMLASEKTNKRRMEAVENIQNNHTSVLSSRDGINSLKSIMVAINSPKGGVGKTAVAIELAFLLAARTKEIDLNPTSKLSFAKKVSVCLVDLNPSFDTMAATLECVRGVKNYPTISDWVNLIERKIFDTLTDEEKTSLLADENKDFAPYINESAIRFKREEILNLLVQDETTGLWILPSISLPFDVEFVKPQYVRIILNQIKAAFDISIVDTGNNISFFTVEVLKAANEILVISTPTSGSSVVLSKLIKNLDRIEVDKSKISLVLNYPNGPKAQLDADTISNVLKLTLVSELPYDENVKLAHEEGIPFSIYNAKSPFAREAKKLAQQIYPLWNAIQKKNKGSGSSLFSFGKKK